MGHTTLPDEPPRTPLLRAALAPLYRNDLPTDRLTLRHIDAVAEHWDREANRPFPWFVPMAPYFTSPRGSMGEEVHPEPVLIGVDLADGVCQSVYGYFNDGVLHVTNERRLPAKNLLRPIYERELERLRMEAPAEVQAVLHAVSTSPEFQAMLEETERRYRNLMLYGTTHPEGNL